MYKHILIATDGSRFAGKGIREGVRLAKALRARITATYVASPFVPPVYAEAAMYYTGPFTRSGHRKLVEKAAKKVFGGVEKAARAAGVRCRTRLVIEVQPWKGILRAARAGRCDAIVMGSHGRGAVGGLLLGSETSRVL